MNRLWGKVQRLAGSGVGSSDPKRGTPVYQDEDIVWSAWGHAAVRNNGMKVTTSFEHNDSKTWCVGCISED